MYQVTLSPEIDACLESAIQQGITPGAVLLVSSADQIVHLNAYGLAQRMPSPRPMLLNTLFDVSSLTKVFSTSAAVMSLVESARLNLEDTVCRFVPAFSGGGREKITISDLLTHGSGLPSWRPFYREILERQTTGGPAPGSAHARSYVLSQAQSCPLVQRTGEGAVYSDIGFILLTQVIENISGIRLDAFCRDHIYKHVGLESMFYVPLDQSSATTQHKPSEFAATEYCSWRNRYLVGEVHDDNASAMGGVSGHAGLFCSILDAHKLAMVFLRAFHGTQGLIYSREIMRDFWRRRVFRNGSIRAYGWDVPTAGESAAGKFFSDLTFGHLGFTGTSLWIDAAREIVVLLFTNRVHPTRDNDRIKQMRPEVHNLIMEKLLTDRQVRGAVGRNLPFDDSDDEQGDAGILPGAGQGVTTPRWIPSTQSRGEPGMKLPPPPSEPPSAIWFRCTSCRAIHYRPELERILMVCPQCDHHHYLPIRDRINLLLDDSTFEERDVGVTPIDPLHFIDSKPYKDRLKQVQHKLNVKDAFMCGVGKVGGKSVSIGAFDFSFMGGSMGSVVGEKVTRVFERALDEKMGAIVVSASGGARMQEGVLSLMQMAKSCAALARLRHEGFPYISIMCHPTTGGVAASFAMLGDVNLAEPRALIGFAGPRVIEQTIRQKLPEGFQRAEYLLEHGMLDRIVQRRDMRAIVRSIYTMLLK